jgi:hypothetical protein
VAIEFLDFANVIDAFAVTDLAPESESPGVQIFAFIGLARFNLVEKNSDTFRHSNWLSTAGTADTKVAIAYDFMNHTTSRFEELPGNREHILISTTSLRAVRRELIEFLVSLH